MKRWVMALIGCLFAGSGVAVAQTATSDLVGTWTVVTPPRDPDNWRTPVKALDLRADSTGSFTYMKNKYQHEESTVPIIRWHIRRDTLHMFFDSSTGTFKTFELNNGQLILWPNIPDSSRAVYKRSVTP